MAKRKDKNIPAPKAKTGGGAEAPAGRSRTAERRIERERQKRRQTQITILGIIVAIAVISVLLIFISSQPAEAPIPEDVAVLYEGLEQSTTDEGYPRLGNADAVIQVVEYSSFDCPHCAEFHENVLPALLQRVRRGEIAFTFVPLYGTGGIANGEGAARTAICAGQQGAFWTMHAALFTWQLAYGQQAFAQNRIITGVDNLGLNRAQYDACMASSTPSEVLATARSQAISRDDFGGTPSVYVNGVAVARPSIEDINAAIDSALALIGLSPVVDDETPDDVPEPVVETTPEA